MNKQLVNHWLTYISDYHAGRVLNERRLMYQVRTATTCGEQNKLQHAITRAKEQEMIFYIACSKLNEIYRETLHVRYMYNKRGIEPNIISEAIDAVTVALQQMENKGAIQYRVIRGYVMIHFVQQHTA